MPSQPYAIPYPITIGDPIPPDGAAGSPLLPGQPCIVTTTTTPEPIRWYAPSSDSEERLRRLEARLAQIEEKLTRILEAVESISAVQLALGSVESPPNPPPDLTRPVPSDEEI